MKNSSIYTINSLYHAWTQRSNTWQLLHVLEWVQFPKSPLKNSQGTIDIKSLFEKRMIKKYKITKIRICFNTENSTENSVEFRL